MASSKIDSSIRLVAMFLDHVIMSMAVMVFSLPGFIIGITNVFSNSGDLMPPFFSGGFWSYFGLIGFAVFFCKDCINGRSPAKRILNLQVVDNKTGLPASPLQCFVRDLFMIIWPIEAIVALINTERRMGDRVAGTKLVKFDPTQEQPPVNIRKVALALLLGYGFMLLPQLLFHKMMLGFNLKGSKIDFVETSLNPREGRELEKFLNDSLSKYLVPEVKIYDSVRNENLKGMVVNLRMKQQVSDEGARNIQALVDSVTMALIYSKYPKYSFSGKIIYRYNSAGASLTTAHPIGTESKTDK